MTANPERRTGASGKAFVTFRLVAGTDDDSVPCSGIAFGAAAEQMAALSKGDAVAVARRAKLNTWGDRSGAHKTGLNVTVDALLTMYHVRRKRQAVAGGQATQQAACRGDDWLDGGPP